MLKTCPPSAFKTSSSSILMQFDQTVSSLRVGNAAMSHGITLAPSELTVGHLERQKSTNFSSYTPTH